MIINVIVMALNIFSQDHTQDMDIAGTVHVTVTIAVIEGGINRQDASVTVLVIVRAKTRYHVGTVDH